MKAPMLILPEEIYGIVTFDLWESLNLGVDEQEGVLRRRKYHTTLSNGNVKNVRFRWFC